MGVALIGCVPRFLVVLLLAGLAGASLIRFAPGFEVDERELDTRWSQEGLERLRESRSVGGTLEFYGRYLTGLATGDLGVSQTFERPVRELLRERAPVSVRLGGYGLLVAWGLGLWLAAVSVAWPNRAVEALTTASSAVLLSAPAAAVALLFLHLEGPAPVALGLVLFPRIFAYARNLFRKVEAMPHVLLARAKGLSRHGILLRHVVAPALPQLVALGGISVSMALGALVPLEVLCDRAGIGQLAWQAAQGRDLPLLVGLTLVVALVTMTANTAATVVARESARRV